MRVFAIIPVCLCLSISVYAQKNKLTYEFPAEMAEPVRAAYVKQWEKGKILYEVNCARCHNTKVKRKEQVPDFNQEQLICYELRVKNPQHESDMQETTVSAEELVLIMTFLTYKKKNK
jgi:hypothetical protein